jgi:hypothetical protein
MQILQLIQGVLRILEKENSTSVYFSMNSSIVGKFYAYLDGDEKIFYEFDSLDVLNKITEIYFTVNHLYEQ